jgi:hypothetical protein
MSWPLYRNAAIIREMVGTETPTSFASAGAKLMTCFNQPALSDETLD